MIADGHLDEGVPVTEMDEAFHPTFIEGVPLWADKLRVPGPNPGMPLWLEVTSGPIGVVIRLRDGWGTTVLARGWRWRAMEGQYAERP